MYRSASFFSWACAPSTSAVYCKPHAFYTLHVHGKMAEEGLNLKKKKPRTPATTAAKTAELWKDHEVDMLLDIFGEETIQYSLDKTTSPKNGKKLSSIVVWATYCLCRRMRTGLSSFVSLVLSVPASKKQRVNGLYPFLDSLRTVPFFYPFPYKTCACKRSNFVGTGACFYPSRSASFSIIICKFFFSVMLVRAIVILKSIALILQTTNNLIRKKTKSILVVVTK